MTSPALPTSRDAAPVRPRDTASRPPPQRADPVRTAEPPPAVSRLVFPKVASSA